MQPTLRATIKADSSKKQGFNNLLHAQRRMVRRLLLQTAIALTTVASALASDVPDVATLRERIATAVGPSPAAYSQTIHYSSAAATGVRHIVRRGSDERVVNETPEMQTEYGVLHAQRWHRNENGHTVLEQPDRIDADRVPFTSTVAAVNNALVIKTAYRSGRRTQEFVDPVTFLPSRTVSTGPLGTTTIEYSDYRVYGKRHLATRTVVRDESTRLTTTSELVDDLESDPGDAAFAIPASRNNLRFPSGVSTLALPVKMAPNGHWFVRVTIGGRGLDFLLDTGAPGIFIDPGTADELGLPIFNRQQNNANGGAFTAGSVRVPEMHVGDLTLADTIVGIAPVAGNELGNVKTVGLLGFDFLFDALFTLDYAHKSIAATVTTENDGAIGAKTIPIRLNQQIPYLTATVNGVTTDRMAFDTGSIGSMLFNDAFVTRHPEAFPARDRNGPRLTLLGVGGTFEVERYTIGHLLLGTTDFTGFEAFRVASSSVFSGPLDGFIGPDFFRLFTVGLDYPHGRIQLTPNADGDRARR
jgi:predicted aspartyl protease